MDPNDNLWINIYTHTNIYRYTNMKMRKKKNTFLMQDALDYKDIENDKTGNLTFVINSG